MSTNLLGSDVKSVLVTALEAAPETAYLVAPSRDILEAAVRLIIEDEIGTEPTLAVLAEEAVCEDVFDEFVIGSRAADAVEAGRLMIHTAPIEANAILAEADRITAIVDTGPDTIGLIETDATFVEQVYDRYRTQFDEAEPYEIQSPPLSRVRETLRAELGPETAADFDAVLNALDAKTRTEGEGVESMTGRLDEVTLSLLAAARNEQLLYDISRWGEKVGIASKATFSRAKNRLEDRGLIDTEKVPIDVGRPRLRLVLTDDRLRERSPAELATAARNELTA